MTRPRMTLLLLTLLWLGGQPLTVSAADAAPPPISIGVVPQQSASRMVRAWGPILRYLEAGTGRRFVFSTAPDIPTFEQRLAEGQYDIAYMNPYHYTVVHRQAGYQAFAKASGKRIQGILVVARDSPLNNLQDLDGSTLAFPAPAAFAASMLPRAHLTRQGIRFTPAYVASHDSVYRAVARGLYPAGGGVMRTFNAIEPALRAKLRLLWLTPGYTPHALAAHPRLDAALVQQIQVLLIGLAADVDGPALLDPLKISGFSAARDADWDDVRQLGLTTELGGS